MDIEHNAELLLPIESMTVYQVVAENPVQSKENSDVLTDNEKYITVTIIADTAKSVARYLNDRFGADIISLVKIGPVFAMVADNTTKTANDTPASENKALH